MLCTQQRYADRYGTHLQILLGRCIQWLNTCMPKLKSVNALRLLHSIQCYLDLSVGRQVLVV